MYFARHLLLLGLAACASQASAPGPPPDPASIDGVVANAHGVSKNVRDLLRALPPSMGESFTLMEASRSRQQTSIEHPRVIMYGTDARFLLAVSSQPQDPLYEVVEMAELDETSGTWRFRDLDMRVSPARLSDDDAACRPCHGHPARPIWGDYAQWSGAFGGGSGSGDDADKLTPAQARSLTEIAARAPASDRYLGLTLPEKSRLDEAVFLLPGRRYGYANTSFNFELGARIAQSLVTRIKADTHYSRARWHFLASTFCTPQDPAAATSALVEMGLSADNDLDIAHPVPQSTDTMWNQGSTTLYELIAFLVLDDALTTAPDVAAAIVSVDAHRRDLLTKWWDIRGEARRAFVKDQFDLTTDDLRPQELFAPVAPALCAAVSAHR